MKAKKISTILILSLVLTCLVPCYSIADDSTTETDVTKAVAAASDTTDKVQEMKEAVSVDKPKNVKAKGISQSKIKVTWDKVKGADGYKVYRYNKSKKKYVLKKTIKSGATLKYVDTGLRANRSKTYKVAAYKKADGRTYKSKKSKKAKGLTKPRTLTVQTTAYSGGGITASGKRVKVGMIAVDPRVIKLGTKVYVPNYGYARAEDTGGAIKGNIIDLYMSSNGQAIQWGRRSVTIRIYD